MNDVFAVKYRPIYIISRVPDQRCGRESIKEGIPGQCTPHLHILNNMYECFDRSDEVPFKIEKIEDWSNITLKECQFKYKGFLCTKNNVTKCIPLNAQGHRFTVASWCMWPDSATGTTLPTCDEIDGMSIGNEILCGNYTFWENVPCPTDNVSSIVQQGNDYDLDIPQAAYFWGK